MKVGPGFCPDFLRSATSRTRCWLLPKGSKISAPAGANRKFSEIAPTVAPSTSLGLRPQRKRISRHRGNTALTGFTKLTMQQCKRLPWSPSFPATLQEFTMQKGQIAMLQSSFGDLPKPFLTGFCGDDLRDVFLGLIHRSL